MIGWQQDGKMFVFSFIWLYQNYFMKVSAIFSRAFRITSNHQGLTVICVAVKVCALHYKQHITHKDMESGRRIELCDKPDRIVSHKSSNFHDSSKPTLLIVQLTMLKSCYQWLFSRFQVSLISNGLYCSLSLKSH